MTVQAQPTAHAQMTVQAKQVACWSRTFQWEDRGCGVTADEATADSAQRR